jgi:hypothetical protein
MNIAMFDLETLSVMPDAAVVQIGLVIGDPVTGNVAHEQRIPLTLDAQRDRRVEHSTLCWWMRQAADVRSSVFVEGGLTPMQALTIVEDALGEYAPEEVWAGPAMFDLPILTSLWGRKPWAYWMERDLSTLRRHVDPRGVRKPPANDKAHDALADALWQFHYLSALLKV